MPQNSVVPPQLAVVAPQIAVVAPQRAAEALQKRVMQSDDAVTMAEYRRHLLTNRKTRQ